MNIAKILKDTPKGTKLYSPLFGECTFLFVTECNEIEVEDIPGNTWSFHLDGTYISTGDCILFPSKKNRDWNKFHERNEFHFKPFDKVLVCNDNEPWRIDLFDHYEHQCTKPYVCMSGSIQHCIPFTEEVAKLIGCTTCLSESNTHPNTENQHGNLTTYISDKFNQEKI